MNVDALLEESKQTFSEISQSLQDGRPDKAAVVKGATQAATVCVLSKGVLSEALGLVRLFCSVHVVGLKAVAAVVDAESEKIRHSELSDGCSESDRAVRLLRVLISSLNSFLSIGRSSAHSSGKHLDVLEGTIAVIRRTIDNLAGEFMDATAGKAAARLRGLTAMVCFGRRRSSRHDQAKETKWNENLVRMGTRDVEKLLKCLSRQSRKDQASSYLRSPGNCVEALGALRRVATAVPEMYPKVVTAFADAVKCMDRASEGEWGHRPSLKNGTVRHTLVACSAHLADRVGRAPDDARREAYNALCAALSDCCIMQTGGYVPVITPPPNSAAGIALREKASAKRKPAHPPNGRDAKIAKVDHRGKTKTAPISPRAAAGTCGVPTEASMIPVDTKNARSEAVVAAPTAEVIFPAEARLTGAREKPCTFPPKSVDKRQTPDVAVPTPASTPAHPMKPASASVQTCSQGNQPSSNGHSCNPAIETVTPTASATAVSRSTEDCRREKRSLTPMTAPAESQSLAPPPERKSMETKHRDDDDDGDRSVGWKEGQRYDVVLGESFYRDEGEKDDGSGRYAHLKYDFVPGRTNLDVPATLRQGPLTGADGQANSHGQQRWAAEMVYESRDPENPTPVRFDGDAARALDVECVLVFDGSSFIMERVSVVGGLKNVQEFSGPVVRSAGGATLEASMARRKKKEGRPKKDEHQQKQLRKRKETTEGGGKEKRVCSEAEAGDKGEMDSKGGSSTAVTKKKDDTGGITINPGTDSIDTERRQQQC